MLQTNITSACHLLIKKIVISRLINHLPGSLKTRLFLIQVQRLLYVFFFQSSQNKKQTYNQKLNINNNSKTLFGKQTQPTACTGTMSGEGSFNLGKRKSQ